MTDHPTLNHDPSEASAPSAESARIRQEGSALWIPIGTSVQEAEKALILATLAHCRRHRRKTATMLGISLKTLYNRLQAFQSEAAGTGAVRSGGQDMPPQPDDDDDAEHEGPHGR